MKERCSFFCINLEKFYRLTPESMCNNNLNISSYPGHMRLKHRIEFLQLQKRKKTFTVTDIPHIAVDWMITSLGFPRLGITVTRKNGSSVQRNLFKRRAREAFRKSSLRHIHIGVDLQIRPRILLNRTNGLVHLDALSFQSILQLFEEFSRYILSVSKRKQLEAPLSQNT